VAKRNQNKKPDLQEVRNTLGNAGLLSDAGPEKGKTKKLRPVNENLPPGRYDFDLAEFPIFRLYKNNLSVYDPKQPLTYKDTIRGKNGELIERSWEVYPSAFGFGGPTTMVTFYDLLQLYSEQGYEGSKIQFGTLRSLFLRRGNRNPSTKDYKRMMRDIDILRGIDIHAENAFWDKKKQAYISKHWRPFNEVYYFKERANSYQAEMPFGFIEASTTLQEIARSRGFFTIGFQSELFHQLKPLEQRLAVYLAKMFKSQKMHIRFVNMLAKALPIEAARPDNVRRLLSNAAQGLINKNVPILASFSIEKSGREGEWVAIFHRKETPKDLPQAKDAEWKPATAEEGKLVRMLIEASDQPEDWRWWTMCAKKLGRDGVLRAIGQFEEKRRLIDLEKPPGALLSAIIKDIARQMGVAIR
jgi:hypothetical protein